MCRDLIVKIFVKKTNRTHPICQNERVILCSLTQYSAKTSDPSEAWRRVSILYNRKATSTLKGTVAVHW